MRIAMFLGSFPVISETFILRQITGLINLGHDVDIYADTRTDSGPTHPEVAAYRLLERTTFMEMPPESAPWEMPVWPLTGRTWVPGEVTSISNFSRFLRATPPFIRSLIRNPKLAIQSLRPAEFGFQASSLSILYRLARLSSRKTRYDVLHAHFGPVAESFRFARELWGAPLVVSFHGFDFSTIPRQRGRDCYRKLFRAADLVTVNSDYTRSRIGQLGCAPGTIRKLPVGLDPGQFQFRERALGPGESPRLLSIGRLVEIKGHEYVIRALPVIRRTNPNFIYDVVGDGPLRFSLEKLAHDLGVGASVKFHGSLDGIAVKSLLDQAHLFVLSSVSIEGDCEGQGLALQEAQACGLPVIATNHGALPEGMRNGISGHLVPERNPEALAECVVRLLRGTQDWPRLGLAGRRFVAENYDIRQLNVKLAGLYAEAAHSFKTRQTR